jgi:hypothetical protein
VATLPGSLDRRRDERWSGNQNRFANTEIDREGDRGSSRDAPHDIDGVIVGCESAKRRTWRGGRRVDVHVRERRGRGVIEIFRVDVKKGRLQETPEKGGSAQNGARYPHDCLS